MEDNVGGVFVYDTDNNKQFIPFVYSDDGIDFTCSIPYGFTIIKYGFSNEVTK